MKTNMKTKWAQVRANALRMHSTAAVLMVGLLVLGLNPSSQAGLIGRWTFNEGSGTTALDSSGNGNNGSLANGASYAVSPDPPGGYTVQLDGVNDYVSFGNPSTFDVTTQLSLEAWVKIPGQPPSGKEPMILGKDYGVYAMTYYYGDGKSYFYVGGTGNYLPLTVPTGAWAHLVGTYDGANMKFYLDGSLATNRALSIAIPVSSLSLASGLPPFSGGPGNLEGQINELRIYNHALSAAEVLADFQAGPIPEPSAMGLGLMTAGAFAWHRFRVRS